MPAESKAKVIERNRAPRVQIAYDVETYGSPTTIELPFVMGVMADLAGTSQTKEASKSVQDRAFVETDANRFPKFMEALAPRVKARVTNTLPQAEGKEREQELPIDLTFTRMSDFAPDKIAEQVPQLAEILKMRRQLEELLGFMDGRVDAEKRIAQLLNNEPLLAKIASQAMARRRPGRGVAMAEEQKSTAVSETETINLDEYSDLLEKDFRVKKDDSERLQQLVRNLALAAQSRSDTTTISSNAIKSIKSLISGIDKMLTEQVNEILHRPRSGKWRAHGVACGTS